VTDPFHHLHQALNDGHDPNPQADVRLDFNRAERTGIPEIVYAKSKHPTDVVAAMRALVLRNGRAIATRVPDDTRQVIERELHDFQVRGIHESRIVIVSGDQQLPVSTGGRVGVISAGTSDLPIAREAAIIAEEMGCHVTSVTDVGVAGLHRLVAPLRDLMASEPDVLVVAAGMDGALPSVVTGLVDVPVIGLPVSTGYGLGGDGTAALYSMLQSCAPGLTVVNIDNGTGAGATAALIANRAASARTSSGTT